jgi:indolepyruvate ferredoxin oxidoreductase alpha subunit
MSALVGAAHDDVNMTVVILDNALIAMTGGQEVLATGEDLIRVVRGLGVDERHIVQLRPVPTDHQKNVEFMRKEIEHRGLSVIVTQRECIHAKRRARDESNAPIALSCSAGSREPG